MYRLRAGLSVSLCGCFALTLCHHTLSPHFVPHTLSPHLVPTPCLFTLHLRTLSLRLVESSRKADGRIFVLVRDSSSSSSSSSQALPALPELPGLPELPAGIDRYRQAATGSPNGAPVWRGHSCLRTSTRADRNVCPTLPRSIAAASRGRPPPAGWRASAGTSPAPDPHRPLPTPIDPRRGWLSRVSPPTPSRLCHPIKSADICEDICACEAGHLRLNQFSLLASSPWRPWRLGGSKDTRER